MINNSRLTIECPVVSLPDAENEIIRSTSRLMSHTEMGYVLPAIADELPHLLTLHCVLEVGNDDIAPLLGISYAQQESEAHLILARMAQNVVDYDPYKITTIDEARLLFGLKPVRISSTNKFIARLCTALRIPG